MFVFKPSLPTPVSSRSLAATFSPRSLTFVFAVIVVLSGFLTSALAQDKKADSQQSASVATGQTSSGDLSQAQATPVTNAGAEQRLVHIVPFDRGASSVRGASGVKNASAPAGAHLTYWGGPVISNIHVVVVFWGTNVDPVVTTPGTIDQFFADITSSKYYDLLTEYSTVGVTGAGTPVASSNQTIGRGQFDAAVTIIPALCPGPATCTLSDAQIQTELTNQLNAGHLPPPVKDAQNIIETFYMIYFPPGVHINLGAAPSCAAGGFCAYHSNTSSLVPYGVLPDFGPTSGCQVPHCGGGTEFENITAVTSHEMSEAVTDAQVGSANILGPPLAWYDPSPPPTPDLGEIGDICGGQDVGVIAGGHIYTVQQEFSNLQNNCVSAPPFFLMNTPPSAGPSLPFNFSVSIHNDAGILTAYAGTIHFTSSDPQAILPADYTFVPGSDGGVHPFSVTLKTLGDQTITVTDTHSSGFTGTSTINVNTTPDLAIAKSHTGNFSVGQTGATYTITVSNVGHGPTSGTVTVVDNLPAGLTATAISGTGWTCTLGTLTCTRADALAATNSYPAINLTVNVAANAQSPITNTATVSGGGETNIANDTASDPTTVLAPDLMVAKGHFGPINGNFFQGETGATYIITVQNPGNLATSGTVTMVDTPPASGLIPTAISGTGWSCTLATLTCTRNDVLAAFSSYPQITVTVDVPLGAPANVINTATVSGGGEVNTANNLTQDPTVILPPPHPDLAPFMDHSFNNFVQGQSGGFYRIDITNVGTATTSGVVTVSDTLPTGLTATDVSGIGWTCTAGVTSTCTQSTPLLFNNSYAPIFITVAIAANAPTSVVNSVTVSGGGEVNLANDTASDPTTIAVPLVDLFPSVAGNAFQAEGDTGINYSILIQNNGNVSSSGTMTAVTTLSTGLTASAISGAGWNCTLATLTCTRSDALTPFSVFTINVTVDFAKNAPATGSVGETVSGGGDGNSANNTNSEFVFIQPMLSIGSAGSQTVNAGTPATYLIIVNPLTIAGPATMSCSGLPAASTCTFTPQPVPAGVGGVGVTLTINTTARTAAVTDLYTGPGNYRPLFPLILLLTGILAAISMRHRLARGQKLKPALALGGLLLLAALSGCGGGGGSKTTTIVQNPQGTPAGTYSITVNAVSPNASASTPVTLIVK
jgi:uncharacterized repeat protein (TIGR01451 family)